MGLTGMVEAKTRRRRRNAWGWSRNWHAAPSTARVRKRQSLLTQGLVGAHREQDGSPAFEKENITRKERQGRIILKELVRGGSWGRGMKDITGDSIVTMPFLHLCVLSLCHLLKESRLGMPGPDREWKPLSLHVCLM